MASWEIPVYKHRWLEKHMLFVPHTTEYVMHLENQ